MGGGDWGVVEGEEGWEIRKGEAGREVGWEGVVVGEGGWGVQKGEGDWEDGRGEAVIGMSEGCEVTSQLMLVAEMVQRLTKDV